MAQLAKKSGAAALIVVNIDKKRPDEIYRLPSPEGDAADGIDIPIVMISYNSAYVLTNATVTAKTRQVDVVNNGMPDRIRLFAGGDRPFFEDVMPRNPVLYLIHNLLSAEEYARLIKKADNKMKPIAGDSLLDLSYNMEKLHNVQRATLWQGLWQLPANKAIEERIEQVTGFPAIHFSAFSLTSMRLDHTDPIKTRPKLGMAIVHHNTIDNGMDLDYDTLHAMMPSKGTMYIAQKFVLAQPVSYARRIVVPLFDFIGMSFMLVQLHNLLVERFGMKQGSSYFDKACVGCQYSSSG